MTAKAGVPDGRTMYTVDELLIEARASLPRRPSPVEALAAQATGALLIDIRGDDQRRTCGLIHGALLLPRNALDWRCDPTGQWRHPAIDRPESASHPDLPGGIPAEPGGRDPATARAGQRHRHGQRVRRLGRGRAASDRPAGNRPRPSGSRHRDGSSR